MQDWIDRLVTQKYKTYGALARAIGMTDSGFGRAVRAGTFELENLLRLADETGESPATVLKMAGKSPANDLIEKLYGTAREKKDPDAHEAYRLMERIADPDARGLFLQLMRVHQQRVDEARQYQAKLFAPAPVAHKAKQKSR